VCLNDNGKRVIQCGHPMCEGCAREWFTRSADPTCPMCRGPFRGKIVRKWVQERKERDMVFETGLGLILEDKRNFKVERLSPYAVWLIPCTKMQKLKEFQEAYNYVRRTYGDIEWDEDDIDEFVHWEVLDEYKDEKPRKVDFREFRNRSVPKRVHWKR